MRLISSQVAHATLMAGRTNRISPPLLCTVAFLHRILGMKTNCTPRRWELLLLLHHAAKTFSIYVIRWTNIFVSIIFYTYYFHRGHMHEGKHGFTWNFNETCERLSSKLMLPYRDTVRIEHRKHQTSRDVTIKARESCLPSVPVSIAKYRSFGRNVCRRND